MIANPLQRLNSLKLKLGIIIIVAITTTLGGMLLAAMAGVMLRWGALAALAVSLLLVQVLSRGLTAPLREMERAAGAMARGEHGQRVTVRSNDEVGRLAVAFNTMAAELDQLDRARRDLLADAAHELRTPITALRASLENAVDGIEEPDADALLAQVQRLARLAEQLLDLSSLEAGANRIEHRIFPAHELAEGVEHARFEIDRDLMIGGDEVRLRQVVANLVENARRHAPGAEIIVRASAAAHGGVRLEVIDDGPGIPAEAARRIFDRFARADRSRTTPGSGLGLSIARSIVELHGGTIAAENVDPHGCRMVIALPG